MQLRTCTSKYHIGAPEIPLSEFSRDRSRKDGYHNHCKLCRREARKHWYIENKEEIAERTKDNYYENHDAVKEKNRIKAKRYKEFRGVSWALLQSVKSRAKKRGLPFDLTEDDLAIPEKCPILGIRLKQEVGVRGPDYPTVDRIDNTRGYTKDNILIISWRANNLKGTGTLEELVALGDWAKTILEE